MFFSFIPVIPLYYVDDDDDDKGGGVIVIIQGNIFHCGLPAPNKHKNIADCTQYFVCFFFLVLMVLSLEPRILSSKYIFLLLPDIFIEKNFIIIYQIQRC